MKSTIFSVLLLVGLFEVDCQFYDTDFECPIGQMMSAIQKPFENGKQTGPYAFECKDFPDVAPENVKCRWSDAALKCNLTQPDGCKEKDAFVGGMKAFDTGANSAILIPKCCTADNIRIDESKCVAKLLNKQESPIDYSIGDFALLKWFTCHFVTKRNRSGSDQIIDQLLFVHECPYETSYNNYDYDYNN